MEDTIRNIKKNIFYRATIFIEDIGSFSPFGVKVKGQDIIDTMAYLDFEESINGQELIDMLRSNLMKEFELGIVQAGAIAYDITIQFKNGDGIFEKRDALCLLISNDGKEWKEEHFPYILIDGQCIWK